jgi:hypothetical protein
MANKRMANLEMINEVNECLDKTMRIWSSTNKCMDNGSLVNEGLNDKQLTSYTLLNVLSKGWFGQ